MPLQFLYFLLFLNMAVILAMVIFTVDLMRCKIPFISTPKKIRSKILSEIDFNPGDKFYDLGCGKGSILIEAAKKYGVSGVGYEWPLVPFLWAKIKAKLLTDKVKIFRQDFFKADLSQANVVYIYLLPEILSKLELKFEKELKPGSKVVCYSFKLPNRPADKFIQFRQGIYIYHY